MPWLINAAQLDKFRKSQKSLIILDATWHLPDTSRDAKQEFVEKHIVDAQFFDIDLFSDPHPDAPHTHMLQQDEKILSEKLSQLGIKNDYKIILYDNSDIHSACRALWMFKMFGHNPQLLYILDGGLNAWNQYNGKTTSGEEVVSPKSYRVNFQTQWLRTLPQMKTNLHHPKEQVVDLRHAVRFAGGPEPRPGIRSGHIPGAFSFPYISLFEKNGLFRPIEKIRQILSAIGMDVNVPITSMCGSGMSAPTLNFVLDLLNLPQNAMYNGSWTEWGAEKCYSGETSLDERPIGNCLEDHSQSV